MSMVSDFKKSPNKKVVDLCLSGGGSKFISQLSFAKTLIQSNRVQIRNIYCCSAGSLVAPFIVTNKLDYLEKYYFNLPGVAAQLIEWNWITKLCLLIAKIPLLGWVETVMRLVCVLFGNGAFRSLDTEILSDLESTLTEEDISNFDRIHVVTTALETGQNHWFNGHSGDDWHWIDAVKASCALMPVMPPVKIANKLYVDGGVTDVCPLENLQPLVDPNVDTLLVTYDYLTCENYTKTIRLSTTIITYLQDLIYLTMAHYNRLQLSIFLNKHKQSDRVKVFTSAVTFDHILDFDMTKRKQLYADGVRNATDYLASLDLNVGLQGSFHPVEIISSQKESVLHEK